MKKYKVIKELIRNTCNKYGISIDVRTHTAIVNNAGQIAVTSVELEVTI